MSSTALTVKTAYHQGTDLVEVPEFDPANYYRDFYLKRKRQEQQRKLANQKKEKEKANKKNVILRIERNNRFITAIKTVTFLAAKFHFYHRQNPIPQEGCPCPKCSEFRSINKDFEESLNFMVKAPPPSVNKLEAVKKYVCEKYKISWNEIESPRRQRDIVQARQEFFRIAKLRTKASYPRMAKFCGGRDHTTALHGVRKYAAEYEKIQEFGSERYLKIFKSCYLRPDDVLSDGKIMLLELEDRRF